MRKTRWFMAFVTGVLAAVIAVFGLLSFRPERRKPPLAASVIISDSSSERWTAFREGLDQGAKKYNISMNIVTTDKLDSIDEEAALIVREIENGAEGVIVEPCARDAGYRLHECLMETPSVFVGSRAQDDETEVTVMPDRRTLGEALFLAALTEAGEGNALRIGVLSGEQEQPAMQEMLESFVDAAKSHGAEISWSYTNSEISAHGAIKRALAGMPDVIAAFDDTALKAAVDALDDADTAHRGTVLVGAGRSPRSIYYLDTGLISTLIVTDDYMMGYEAARRLAETAGTIKSTHEEHGVGFAVVTPTTLHNNDTERILFPQIK